MILDCSNSRDSLPPAFVTLLLDIILCALIAACPDSSLVIVYSIGLPLLSLTPLIDSCLFDFETVLIKLQMDLHASDPSLQYDMSFRINSTVFTLPTYLQDNKNTI